MFPPNPDDPIVRAVAAHSSRPFVVALSGGVDSIVLLHAAHALGAPIAAVHVDHQLRPDSADDRIFCARTCRALGIPFEAVEIDVEKGNSTQGRARIQRYAALFRAASRFGIERVATAHHADDREETALLQAARAAGPVALAGPRPQAEWRGWPLVRPLLEVSRATIEAWATARGLRWHEDPTNADERYARVRVRDDIRRGAGPETPLAERLRIAERLEAKAALVRRQVQPLGPIRRAIRRDALRDANPDVRIRALLDLAVELHGALPGALAAELSDAIEDANAAPRTFCGRHVLVDVDRDWVVFEASRGQGTRRRDADPPQPVRWNPAPGEALPWFEHRLVATVDPAPGAVWVESRDLTIRPPGAGDRLELGDRRPKISDLLAQAGVSPFMRPGWPCVYREGICRGVVGIETGGLDASSSDSSKRPGIFVARHGFPDRIR